MGVGLLGDNLLLNLTQLLCLRQRHPQVGISPRRSGRLIAITSKL
jgi:hypothetical protein